MRFMCRIGAVFAAVFAVLPLSVTTQQASAPAAARQTSSTGAAQAGRGAPPQPVRPVAVSTVAANPERYAGTTVSLTAAVQQQYGATTFSVSQTRRAATGVSTAGGPDVLVVAPLLTAPVQPGAYVTVIGEVVTFDQAAVAARMKEAAPPADVAAKYVGRPAILATSVINESMTDLAKKLPPPMTPEELQLNRAMKQVGPAFTALRQAVAASNTSDARDQAAALSKGFTEAAAFWRTQTHADASQWTEDARKMADEIAAIAAKPDPDALRAAVPKLQQICTNCHTQYRERLDDGSYRLKGTAR